MQNDTDRKRPRGAPPAAAGESDPGRGPDYHWGGYATGDRQIASGYVSEGGYGPYDSEGAAVPGLREDRSGSPPRSDSELATEIERLLSTDGRLSPFPIVAQVQDGVVFLFGDVPTQFKLALAGKLVSDLDGVQEVANRIRLRSEPPD